MLEAARESRVPGAWAKLTPSPPRFLVCPPDYFDTDFLFNPFMSYRERVRPRRARRQWRRLVRALEEAGAVVETMEPEPVSSALPFTADGAYCYAPGRAMILRNDGPRGDCEPPVFAAWFREHGYEVESQPPAHRLDGGNLLQLGPRDLLAGLKGGAYGPSERYLASIVDRLAGVTTWTIPLTHERHLHLDTVVGILGPEAYLVYPGALEGRIPDDSPLTAADPIEVSDEDARLFACNLVVVGETVLTGRISAGLTRRIERFGYAVERLELSEFHKAGGGIKCLTLPLWPPESQGSQGGG